LLADEPPEDGTAELARGAMIALRIAPNRNT
jgi:hypothetical protein